ncbi:hypothetical protein ACJ41O_014060 [Fusarium nematophilum]
MHRPDVLAFLLPLLVAAPAYGGETLDCKNIRVDGHTFDLSKLEGPHSVVTTKFQPNPPEHKNTTYTLDICKPLKKSGGPKTEECPNGTRVCAITHVLREKDGKEVDDIDKVVAIAGNLQDVGGTRFEVTPTRLKTSDSNSDSQKEGLRLVLTGGKDPLSGAPASKRQDQKAIIEFLCDPDREGTEGEWTAEDKYTRLRARDEEKDGDDDEKNRDEDGNEDDGESSIEHQLKHDNASLIWGSFQDEQGPRVLRLTWHTKYACENREDNGGDDGGSSISHWGFFTWFILIAFLGIAGYLIFSSWINFTRYGARGWDLLPHSDTIRDIPYLFKDWLRRVLNTVQGTGSRGGYSAV